MHAIQVDCEAQRKATSSEEANVTEPSKGAKKLKQDRPQNNGETPARNSKPLNTKQRARLVNIAQKLDEVKEDYNQFGRYK
jgi:hypothetical protein